MFFSSLRAHDSEGISQRDKISGNALEIGMKGCVPKLLLHSKSSHLYISTFLRLEALRKIHHHIDCLWRRRNWSLCPHPLFDFGGHHLQCKKLFKCQCYTIGSLKELEYVCLNKIYFFVVIKDKVNGQVMLHFSKAKIVSQELQKTFSTNQHVPCT